VRLVPLKDKVIGDVRQPLLFLLGAVALVLIIGCANVANLLLVRATTRGRELAMRQALGADPRRIARQLITESVVLSTIGGLLGIAVVIALRGSFVRLIPANVPRLNDIAIDWRVLLFALAASLASGVMFGLAPALDLRRLDVTRVLKQEGRGATSSGEQKRTRQWLVVTEFALSLVLLSAAGLLVRSFWQLLNAPLGFDPQNVTVVRTRLPYPNYKNEDLYPTAAAEERFAREVIRRVSALVGVQAVALGSGAAVPLDHPEQDQAVVSAWVEDDRVHGHQAVLLSASEVTPAYFHVLGLPLLRGRLLDDFDTEQRARVAVINEAMARNYWPGQDAVGKRLKLSHETRETPWTTVVGVIADARTESLATTGVPQLYVSLYQTQGKHLAVFVRGRVPTDVIARQVQTEVQSINPALPVFGAQTLAETVSGSLAVRRFSLELIGLFALTALVLAAIGIYGVISYMVTERTHEIAVRMALGAQRADVLWMVMSQGMQLAIAGAALGLVGAVVVSHAIAGVLVGVRPTDFLTFGAATVFLTLVAVAATFLPARRAIYVDPNVALR
jgi:putative ABC transport system permease protein